MTERRAVWRRPADIEPNYTSVERRQTKSSRSTLHSRLGSVIIRDNHSHERQLNLRLTTLAVEQTRQVGDECRLPVFLFHAMRWLKA